MLAPIALFVYNRKDHLKLALDSLVNNMLSSESELIIFSDGGKNDADWEKVNEIRKELSSLSGFKRIELVGREKNYGLAESVIEGVSKTITQYGKVIVLEDDLVLSKYFLQYMNDALELYKDESSVISIHGYLYPVKEKLPETFFLKGADCWGWGTWKRGWDLLEPDGKKLLHELKKRKLEFEFDHDGTLNNVKMLKRQIAGEVNSWAIRWHASAFLNDKLTLYPGRSLVNNIGTDWSGTHTKKTNIYYTNLSESKINVAKIPIEKNESAKRAFEDFFKKIKPNFVKRYFKKIKHSLG